MEGGGNGMERETGGIAIKGFDPPNPVDKQSSFPFWLYGNGPIFFSNHPATNLEIADGGAILDEMSWLTAFLTDVSRGRGRARGALDGGILTILYEVPFNSTAFADVASRRCTALSAKVFAAPTESAKRALGAR